MHTQMFWFKHGFLAWTQRKGLYFARLEVTSKKKHTLIFRTFLLFTREDLDWFSTGMFW